MSQDENTLPEYEQSPHAGEPQPAEKDFGVVERGDFTTGTADDNFGPESVSPLDEFQRRGFGGGY